MPDLRLIRAEILKLRRRPGLMAATGVLAFASAVLYFVVLAALHALDPSGHAGAGGAAHFDDAMGILGMAAPVAAVLVGATAGGADIEAGVFRDLAATGRSRTALFAARLPGAWAIVVPPVLAAIAVCAGLASVLDGPGAAPTAHDVIAGGSAALVATMLVAAVSVGLAALSGSRGMVIGVVLAFQLGVPPVLAQVEILGAARHAIPAVATARLDGALASESALGTAIGVILAWAVVSLGAGLWRTRTQEIWAPATVRVGLMRRALAAAADLVLRRRPLAALAADAALPVNAPFALLALVPLYGIAVHRPWRTTAAGVAAVALAELVHLAAWGSRGGLAAVAATTGLAVVVAAIARPCASAAGARRASRRCSPSARSPRSGCGSPASCTTRSGTTSR